MKSHRKAWNQQVRLFQRKQYGRKSHRKKEKREVCLKFAEQVCETLAEYYHLHS